MDIQNINILKSDERGIIYDCGASKLIVRKKGSISANHTHKEPETVYFVKGEAELTIGEETKIVKAPVMFRTDSDVYHKLVALTDIELIVER